MTETLLNIEPFGIVPASARDLTQTLEPIAQATAFRRTVNGGARDVSAPQFKKYSTTITCTDQMPPAFDGIFPGDTVTIHCVKELSYKTLGGSPNKPVVPGSSHVVGDYTFYRPKLTCIVTAVSGSRGEYSADEPWTLTAEEI